MTFGTALLYGLMRSLGLLAVFLPREVALAIGTLVARIVWLLYRASPYREFVASNILAAYPDRGVPWANHLGKRSLELLTRSIVEVMRFPVFAQEAARIVAIEGREHLDDTLKARCGVIIVTAHFGNWELLAATLAREFGPLSVLVQTPSKDAFARLFMEYRRLVGVTTYSNCGNQSLRPIIRALRNHELVGLLCDQHGPAREASGTFLGHRVWVPMGPFVLAKRTGARILPAHLVRGPDDRHTLVIQPPLPVWSDPNDNAQELMDTFEQWITHHQDHWLWVHNRWEFARRLAGPCI